GFGQADPLLPGAGRGHPGDASVALVEGDDLAVTLTEEDEALPDRHAGLPPTRSDAEAWVERRNVMPEDVAVRCIDREDIALRRRGVHDPLVEDGVLLLGAAGLVLRARGRIDRADAKVDMPGELQLADVRRCDLRECRI